MLAAYQRSRDLFDRMEASAPGDVALRRPVEIQNRRLIVWRRTHMPFRSDAHEAIVLLGALARVAGGYTLGEAGTAISAADITGAWCEAVLAAAGLAAMHTLAIGPVLECITDLVTEFDPGTGAPVDTLAAAADLCTLASATVMPGGDDGVEAIRRAMFAALGQVLTCGWIEFTRRVSKFKALQPTETPRFYFVGAVDLLIGVRRGGSDV